MGSPDPETLLKRCDLLDTNIALSLRIDELENEVLRRDVKKLYKRLHKGRRFKLRALAELDQLTASLKRNLENHLEGK